MVIDSVRPLVRLDRHDKCKQNPRRLPDRMAGRAFALAADPSLLAADARHRGRLRHRGGAARRVQGFPVSAVATAASSAPTSPFRTRSWRFRCRSRTRAPARSARPIRCGSRMASSARPTPTSKVLSTISTPALMDGTHARRRWCSAPAVHRARFCIGLLDRGIKRVHLANRTMARARALADQFGERVVPVAWDALGDLLPRAGAAGEYDLARHEGPAAARTRCRAVCRHTPSSPISSTCRSTRHC